jgi:NAD-reducing hydrogenase small subunit
MSFLDLDERLIELADRIELVYSPLADVKEFPANVDLALVEGAVSNTDNEELARRIRRNARYVVAFGDCASTGNVTAMRNRYSPDEILHRSYVQLADGDPTIPGDFTTIARLLPQARPLHEVIRVDAFLNGCPPSPGEIWLALTSLLEGRDAVLPTIYQRFG